MQLDTDFSLELQQPGNLLENAASPALVGVVRAWLKFMLETDVSADGSNRATPGFYHTPQFAQEIEAQIDFERQEREDTALVQEGNSAIKENLHKTMTVFERGMANRTKVIAFIGAPKGVLCGKSAVLIQPQKGVCSYALTTLLNSQGFVNLYRGLFAMRGMSGKSLNIGPRQIKKLPIPQRQYLQEYTGTIHQNMAVLTASNLQQCWHCFCIKPSKSKTKSMN